MSYNSVRIIKLFIRFLYLQRYYITPLIDQNLKKIHIFQIFRLSEKCERPTQ